MDRGEMLFAKYDFRAVIGNASAELVKAIDALPDGQLFEASDDARMNALVTANMIAVPDLDLDAICPSEREVDIDLSRDPRERFMRDLSGPYHVKGTEISFRIPFKGDADVFRCRPSSYTLNPPYADIGHDAIVIRIIGRDKPASEYRKEFDATLHQIQDHLKQLRVDCAGLEASLRSTAAAHLAKRRDKRQKDRSLLGELGFEKPKQQ